MKKNILLAVFLAFVFTSCDKKEKFENEESAVVEIAGEWYVHYDHPVYGPDPFGAGYTSLITYNTSADDGQTMWINDQGNFWTFQVKVPVNISALAFGSQDTVINAVEGYDIKVLVRNGKVIKHVSLRPSGAIADSIYFELWFEDLEGSTGIASDTLIVSGYRRTGFLEDEP
jgi:hypothetical protein